MLQVARLAPQLLGASAEKVLAFLQEQWNADGGARDRAGPVTVGFVEFAENRCNDGCLCAPVGVDADRDEVGQAFGRARESPVLRRDHLAPGDLAGGRNRNERPRVVPVVGPGVPDEHTAQTGRQTHYHAAKATEC